MAQTGIVGEADIKDLEVRGRYLRRRGFGGYRAEDVDGFLVEVGRGLRDLLEENESLRAGVNPSGLWFQESKNALRPLDVQEARFRRVRIGGYDMRSVDDYLDDVTDVVTALLQENEALRRASPELGTEDVSR